MLTEEQFSYLAKKYMDMVFRLALHYTKSRSESDDITQEVLLKLYRTDKPFESEDHVRYRAGWDSSGSGLLRIRSDRVRNVQGRSGDGYLRHWLGGIAKQHGG